MPGPRSRNFRSATRNSGLQMLKVTLRPSHQLALLLGLFSHAPYDLLQIGRMPATGEGL